MELTQQRLKYLLKYDAKTGLFTRRVRTSFQSRVGDVAGTASGKLGHIQIRIDGHKYHANRLAFFWMDGVWPAGDVDHINGISSDNRLENLRDVTRAVNCQNRRRAHSNNESGLLGVSRDKRSGRWQSRIMVAGKSKSLGMFDAPEDAHSAYVSAKRDLHEGCTI